MSKESERTILKAGVGGPKEQSPQQDPWARFKEWMEGSDSTQWSALLHRSYLQQGQGILDLQAATPSSQLMEGDRLEEADARSLLNMHADLREENMSKKDYAKAYTDFSQIFEGDLLNAEEQAIDSQEMYLDKRKALARINLGRKLNGMAMAGLDRSLFTS